MNRIIKPLIIIGIFLFFLLIQSTVINRQRAEILATQNTMDLRNQEYEYFNSIDINAEAKILQEQDWTEMENITKSDFTSVVEKLQQNFQKHGWMIIGFQQLEEEITKESNNDELVEINSNNQIKIKSINYELQFIIKNDNIIFPKELFSETTENILINSIEIIINDEESLGVLNITYHQQEINEDVIPEI